MKDGKMIKHLIGALFISSLLIGSTPVFAAPLPDIAIIGCVPQRISCDAQTQQCVVEYQVLFPAADIGQLCDSYLESYVRAGFEILSIDSAGSVFLWADDASVTTYHLRRNRGGGS